jgi:hypothetical protein
VSGQVSGHATADLVHLLAELVDNAIAFPPHRVHRDECCPQRTVTRRCDRGITDEGIGLSPAGSPKSTSCWRSPPETRSGGQRADGLGGRQPPACAAPGTGAPTLKPHRATSATVRIPRAIVANRGGGMNQGAQQGGPGPELVSQRVHRYGCRGSARDGRLVRRHAVSRLSGGLRTIAGPARRGDLHSAGGRRGVATETRDEVRQAVVDDGPWLTSWP